MGIGTSVALIAVGAILKYAVNADIEGIEIETVGLILMIAGIIGLAISLLYLAIWSDRRRGGEVVEETPVTRRYREPPL